MQTMLPTEEGVYVWEGIVAEGEMKFFVEKDFLALAYGAIEDTEISATGEYALALLAQEDKKFVTSNAEVQMCVNLKDMTLNVVMDILNSVENVNTDDSVMLYDIMGNLRMATTEQISTNTLPAGIYIVKTATQSKKIIIK